MDAIIRFGTVVKITTSSEPGADYSYGKVVTAPDLRPGATPTPPGHVWVNERGHIHAVSIARLTALDDLPTVPEHLRLVLAGADQDERSDIHDQLCAQIGSQQAWKLFHPIDSQIVNGERIDDVRGRYRDALQEALLAVASAMAHHNALVGDLYDIELAEGTDGQHAQLALRYLDDALRALKTVRAINPNGVFTENRG